MAYNIIKSSNIIKLILMNKEKECAAVILCDAAGMEEKYRMKPENRVVRKE